MQLGPVLAGTHFVNLERVEPARRLRVVVHVVRSASDVHTALDVLRQPWVLLRLGRCRVVPGRGVVSMVDIIGPT